MFPHLSPCPNCQWCFLPNPYTLIFTRIPHNSDTCEVHQPVLQNESQIQPLLSPYCQHPGPPTNFSLTWRTAEAFRVVSYLSHLSGLQFIFHIMAKWSFLTYKLEYVTLPLKTQGSFRGKTLMTKTLMTTHDPITPWPSGPQYSSPYAFSDNVWPTLWMSCFFWLCLILAEIFLQRGFSWLFYFRPFCISYLTTLFISSVTLCTTK